MMRLLSFALCGLFAFNVNSAEQTVDLRAIATCTSISNEQQRLACFDKNTENLKIFKGNKEQLSKKSEILAAKTKPPIKPVNKIVETEDDFGKKKPIEEEKETLDTIHSTITGKFNGWKKGGKISLANGQVWKVLSSTKGYVNLTNPEATITRTIFGSFKMSVKGINSSAKVKRIK